MSKVHRLKVDPELWPAVKEKKKTADIRFNDRGFQKGDVLFLSPFHKDTQLAGPVPFVRARILHVLRGGKYGVELGYCLLSLQYFD